MRDCVLVPKAEADANGMVSRDYAGLFRRQGAGWITVAAAVGPTDVVWEG